MKKILYLIVLIWSMSAHASNIDHVNIGRITVSDQSVNSQQLAGKQALAQVFVKISGNSTVLDTTEIARAVDNYEQFLVSSSFLQQQNDWIFEATFNQQKIEQLLMATGLNVWTSLRPSAVLWLAKESTTSSSYTNGAQNNETPAGAYSSNQRVLVSENQAADLGSLVKISAYQRGVDIIIPLGDLDDAVNISVYDVWNQFVSRLMSHSKRYNTDYVINATMQAYAPEDSQAQIGLSSLNIEIPATEQQTSADALNDTFEQNLDEPKNTSAVQNTNAPAIIDETELAPEGTTHKLDYIITNRSKVHTGRLYGKGENELVVALVDKYADILALEFSLTGANNPQEQASSVSVVVSNIRNLKDYVEFKQLLESVPAVSSVKLEKQSGTRAYFSVYRRIGTQQLSAILSLDKRVQVDLSLQQDAGLRFMWQD